MVCDKKCENKENICSLLNLFYRKCLYLQIELNKITRLLLNKIYMSISKMSSNNA